uniref:Arylformamidase n=2 Tax=Oryzias sinensis TaxID=183150 RepID=A0A8C7X3G1_9TELE
AGWALFPACSSPCRSAFEAEQLIGVRVHVCVQQELERQYSPSRWSHRMDADAVIQAHVKALKAGTERARSLAQTLLNIPYGEGDGEKLDVYIPKTNSLDLNLVIYIHGGYWQFLSKEESGFLAVPLTEKGVVVVAVGYDIAPKGNMDLMVSQVRRSVVSIVQQYSHIRGLYLCGHSAGAHLAAMVLSTDWSQYSLNPQIKGRICSSAHSPSFRHMYFSADSDNKPTRVAERPRAETSKVWL